MGDEVGVGAEEGDDADGGEFLVGGLECLDECFEVVDAGLCFGVVVGAGGGGGVSGVVDPGDVVGGVW